MNEIPEIKLGTILFSLAEPKPGHEREYNRWYERDHFFAGCMVGANYFSGRRWVATKPLKALRFPADTPIVDDIARGSFLHTYWILDGTYPETLRWSVDQVVQLFKQKRMEPPRDNISSGYYRYDWGVFRDADGVPPELALEYPYQGVGTLMIDKAAGVSEDALVDWLKLRCKRSTRPNSSVAMMLCLRPEPLPADAPGNVPRPDPEVLSNRYLLLSFLEEDPLKAWGPFSRNFGRALGSYDLGRVIHAAAFIPTLPGTDKYIDEL